ncbi:recombinase family protein [Stenotrophomonas rhizophila]|uniref:recombinase family protein n=1 Tax=Stenotrophomonas rhizophila TaxID=216778 RepID=UPI000B804070|nr:recombinase family protein [Stenotrophomonas rhizophila]
MNNAATAVVYLRTSSAANVGDDKDSHTRQLAAINAYAKRNGVSVVHPPFYDAAVSGADPVDARPGFTALLAYLGVHPECRTILVESANRFARDLIVQETGYKVLQRLGINLIAVDSPGMFLDDTPTAKLIRQILGAVAEFDKAVTVMRLRSGREKKRLLTGKPVGGNVPMTERAPQTVALAKKLYRRNPNTGERRSIPQISAELAAAGHVNSAGKTYGATQVRRMLGLVGAKSLKATKRIGGKGGEITIPAHSPTFD